MTTDPSLLRELAVRIDPERCRAVEPALAGTLGQGSGACAAALALSAAYPAVAAALATDPTAGALGFGAYAAGLGGGGARLRAACAAVGDREGFLFALRRGVACERLALALAELLPAALGGPGIEATSRAVSELADASIALALEEAIAAVVARTGPLCHADGSPGALVVLGMGKLGGGELNPGSDVDLVCFYDSDEAEARDAAGRVTSAHEVWTKVVRRMTASLADHGEGGFAWRVDHRLRPEGGGGPLVNSLAAAERYYEQFGRLWERAALVRARPVAGDLAFGRAALEALGPFVWRRAVDPSIAATMTELLRRARAKLREPARDLKLGPGGIREAEFFVQTLQLVWGGRERRLRCRGTFEALERLRATGFVTEREAEEVGAAYALLRRAEHAVQHATGLQTHELPRNPAERDRLARVLGLASAAELAAELAVHTRRVAARSASLLPEAAVAGARPASRWDGVVGALDRGERAGLEEALARLELGGEGSLARDLLELGRAPLGPLGAAARERDRPLCDAVLDAIADAADCEQAARFLRSFVQRLSGFYDRMLAGDPARLRKLVTAFGASTFVGEAVARRPELGDALLFAREPPATADAHREVMTALAQLPAEEADDFEAQCGALRKSKERLLVQVAQADLTGDLDDHAAAAVLTALADASLGAACRLALAGSGGADAARGLCLLGMGKLGGREMGYGSDLDVIFLYDPACSPGPDAGAAYTRAARRVIQLVSLPHAEGRGYELDTRLRPSGTHGLLVVSLDAFARYHGLAGDAGVRSARANIWERQALLRARFCAGDPEVGARAVELAGRAAYESESDPARLASEIHRLRMRMEHELGRERPGRFDLKLGRGGLCDVEFAVQFLQLAYGADPRVRTPETGVAITALAEIGALSPRQAEDLRAGHDFLWHLKQRIRIVHDDASHLIERDAAGMVPLARRMGYREGSGLEAAGRLLERYREITDRVRRCYEEIVVARAA